MLADTRRQRIMRDQEDFLSNQRGKDRRAKHLLELVDLARIEALRTRP